MDRDAAEPGRFGAEQHALGIEALQENAEALPFGTDAVFLGHEQVVDEQHVRADGVTAHLGDQAMLDLGAVEPGVEQRQPLGLLLHLLERRGARDDQHVVGDVGVGDPDLLAVEQIAAIDLLRPGS